MILLDTREPQTVQARILAAFPAQVTLSCLVSGDVVLFDGDGCGVGIERKTVSDLLGSLSSGRLDRQLKTLADTYDFPVLVIEGVLARTDDGKAGNGKRGSGWAWSAVQMKLWSYQRRLGVQILQVRSEAEFGHLVAALQSRARRGCYKEASRAVDHVGRDQAQSRQGRVARARPSQPARAVPALSGS